MTVVRRISIHSCPHPLDRELCCLQIKPEVAEMLFSVEAIFVLDELFYGKAWLRCPAYDIGEQSSILLPCLVRNEERSGWVSRVSFTPNAANKVKQHDKSSSG